MSSQKQYYRAFYYQNEEGRWGCVFKEKEIPEKEDTEELLEHIILTEDLNLTTWQHQTKKRNYTITKSKKDTYDQQAYDKDKKIFYFGKKIIAKAEDITLTFYLREQKNPTLN